MIDGSSVLVAAPTGAGKTVVGEFAAWLALKRGGKAFYTTPIKALSNQKYRDFVALHGLDNVGLLTGDNSVNGGAPIVVMTTEVLRNMLYEDSADLAGLRYVVLDEVHYLQDPYRGAVWEEVVIHLPIDVQTISLSATVSNAEEFAEWLQALRGRVEVVIEETRPVELRYWYLASDELLPMFIRDAEGDWSPNPRARELERRRRKGPRPSRGGRRVSEKRARIPWRTEVVDRLDEEKMLPAIYFIFSRKGCDEAVRQCLNENISLTTSEERQRIIEFADLRTADIPAQDLAVLGYDQWLAGLSAGIAAHHAGQIPAFKETVEQLFNEGMVKVVFATETLALGINMPARSVAIESLVKFTGEKHELMTAGALTQLAGRAGRRGIDELGHCVILLQKFTPFDTITHLASTRTYPLRSSFQTSYNMAVNLVRNYDRADAEHLVNSSFAQFQADRDVVRLEKAKEQLEGYLASYEQRAECELGDVEEYRKLDERVKRLQKRAEGRSRGDTTEIRNALEALREGEVIDVEAGRRKGRYVVLDVDAKRSDRGPRVVALSSERSVVRLAAADFRSPPRVVAKLRLPARFNPRDARSRRLTARRLAELRVESPDLSRTRPKGLAAARAAVEEHPVHKCPDAGRHLHFADRAVRLRKDIAAMGRRIGRRTGTLARRFERVLDVLASLDYVDDWSLTRKGETLRSVYNESDLLVVEALERKLLDDLSPPEIAALLSSLVYEARGAELAHVGDMPTAATRRAWSRLMKIYREIRRREEESRLELTREPDPGFAERAYMWASGADLHAVLDEDQAAGDFVRTTKQLADLLRQIEEVAPSVALGDAVDAALAGVVRSIVAYSSL